ncbi:unnamed protein product [Aphanomyces euteiches]
MVVATYLLLVIRGLEDLAIAEIQEKLEVVSIEVLTLQADPERKHRLDVERGQAAVGKLVVHTTSSPERVKSLCSVQAFLAYIAHSDALTTTDEVAGPEQIATLVEQSSRWNDALVLWKLHVPSTESSIRFRASCVRDGTHKYSSEVIAGKVGAAIVRKFHWTVSLVDFDLEVVAIVMHHDVICGISLAADPKTINFRGARLAPEPRRLASFQYMSTLRPSTAYLMLQLATCNAGDVVLDCMCGVGTIPACSSHWAPVFGLGGDVSPDAVAQARVNLQQSPRAAVCLWSSERLPLRPESVDRILVDMPFGIQCGNATKNSRLYPKALQEMARVLRPNGTAGTRWRESMEL